jgi:hypothetical protein
VGGQGNGCNVCVRVCACVCVYLYISAYVCLPLSFSPCVHQDEHVPIGKPRDAPSESAPSTHGCPITYMTYVWRDGATVVCFRRHTLGLVHHSGHEVLLATTPPPLRYAKALPLKKTHHVVAHEVLQPDLFVRGKKGENSNEYNNHHLALLTPLSTDVVAAV